MLVRDNQSVQEVPMRVNQTGTSNVSNNETTSKTEGTSKTKKTQKTDSSNETSKTSGSNATDVKAEISTRGRELLKAKQTATEAPDVREERIAELKRRIQAGAYKVDSAAVADKMVDEHMSSGIG